MGTVPVSTFDDDFSLEPEGEMRLDSHPQGDIEQALTHQLAPFPARIQAQIQAGILEITLWSSEELERQGTVLHLQRVLSELALSAVNRVQLQCQAPDAESPRWQQVWFGPQDPVQLTHRLDLRERASQGCLVTMAMLVQEAVAHKSVQVQAGREGEHLWLYLCSAQLPEPQTWAMLVCRELTQWSWQPTGITQVTLVVARAGAAPSWQRELTVAASPDRLSIAQMAVGHRSQRSAHPLGQRRDREATLPLQPLDRDTWRVLAASGLLAILVLWSPQVSFFFSILITAIHELGHTILAWLFGYPAIPAFDFLHGGGITFYTQQRWPVLVFMLYFGLGCLLYRYRHNSLTSRYLLGLLGFYTLCLLSKGQDILIVAMGHGFELLFAGIFLYRGLSGFACRHALERPLYGMLGLFTILYNLKFTQNLLWNPVMRSQYQAGKGGMLDHDLVRLARDYLHLPFNGVVGCFWVACLITPLVAFGLYRYRYWMLYHLKQCLQLRYP